MEGTGGRGSEDKTVGEGKVAVSLHIRENSPHEVACCYCEKKILSIIQITGFSPQLV